MTTTTEATTDTEGADLLGDARRAAEHAESASLAVIRPEQQRFDDNQKAILRQLGIEDATDGDLDLFFHVCRTTGLDPFRRQIYMIGRNTKVTEWIDDDRASNGRRKVEKWVTKYTIQTGIDGYRRNVREAAKTLGDDLRFEGPFFTGENDFHINEATGEVIQHWRKVWPERKPPHAARFVVFRNGEEFEGIAHYDEFVQTGYQDEPNSMWRKMPRNQIGKCAEALAYRRAYPDDLSGLILEDAAQPTVVDEDGNVLQRGRATPVRSERVQSSGPVSMDDIVGEPEPAKPKRKPAAKKAAPKEEPQDAEVVEDDDKAERDLSAAEAAADGPNDGTATASDSEPKPEPAQVKTEAPVQVDEESVLRKAARDQLNKAIFATFNEAGLGGDANREDRLVVIEAIVGRHVESSKELHDEELQNLRNSLIDRKKAGVLDADINDWLNRAALIQAEAAEAAKAATEEGN